MGEKKTETLAARVRKGTVRIKKRYRIMFVCTGNTCRSAMAEQIFRNYLKEKKRHSSFLVVSRGLYVTEVEGGMNILARQALKSLQIRFSKHVPTQLDIVSVLDANLVICMERAHKDMIVRAVGDLPHIKTMDEITARGDIEDPYGTDFSRYINTAKKLLSASESIFEYLEERQNDSDSQEDKLKNEPTEDNSEISNKASREGASSHSIRDDRTEKDLKSATEDYKETKEEN